LQRQRREGYLLKPPPAFAILASSSAVTSNFKLFKQQAERCHMYRPPGFSSHMDFTDKDKSSGKN
jgi:hypothetical protein